jgi:hypothetical protein
MSQKCPKCGLLNPENAQRCDCGYDFEKNEMSESPIKATEKPNRKFHGNTIVLVLGLVLLVGGLGNIAKGIGWSNIICNYSGGLWGY